MPKKTKKQKINAELRRKNFLLNQVKKVENLEYQLKKTPTKYADQQDTTIKVKDNTEDVSYFNHDFKKSLIIVAIIIALEIVIYFGTII